MKRKMILDCDTGHDDAIALMVAARHPDIELLGVTVVAGNQTLPKTLKNTLPVAKVTSLHSAQGFCFSYLRPGPSHHEIWPISTAIYKLMTTRTVSSALTALLTPESMY